nr:GTPase domain-containing protein [Kibdelosporangium phytohabitans]
MVEHHLPATYGNYVNRLVVGLVGAPNAGKTHLFTAMVRQIDRQGLLPYGLSVGWLDMRAHSRFRQGQVEPFESGNALAGTRRGVVDYAGILVLRRFDGVEWAVTFFDIAGEDLRQAGAGGLGSAGRFLAGADAFLFVYAPDDPVETGTAAHPSENRAFALAIERMRATPALHGRPAAIAFTKADRLRYVPPIGRWLRGPDGNGLDAARTRAESRDIFAYLHDQGAGAALAPFSVFPRCTLHAVSATGGDAQPRDGSRVFPRGVRPMRVLEPLVAILAMAGVIPGDEAGKVGIP